MKKASNAIATLLIALPILIIIAFCLTLIFSSSTPIKQPPQVTAHQTKVITNNGSHNKFNSK